MENKKILGARITIYKDIKFRSSLECSCYKKLEESGLVFSHESEKFTLWEGTKLGKLKLYTPDKKGVGKYGRDLNLQTRALLHITYTPDFKVVKNNNIIYIDSKGKENDTYGIKRKMFLKILDNRNDGNNYFFFEPHNIRQMLQTISIIKAL